MPRRWKASANGACASCGSWGPRPGLGFALGLYLRDFDTDDAVAAGFAFARAALTDTRPGGTDVFFHQGHSFRVVTGKDREIVMLVPEHATPDAPPAAIAG